jgi:hypothetical protein
MRFHRRMGLFAYNPEKPFLMKTIVHFIRLAACALLVLTGTACPRSSSQPAIKELRQEIIIVVPQTNVRPEKPLHPGDQPQPPHP